MKLSLKAKRGLLVFHCLFAAIMLGNMVVFLIFSIMISASDQPNIVEACQQGMYLLSRTSVRASTIGTTVTGVWLSVWSKWGLFKFYWIIAKEGLTVLCIAINLWGMYSWTKAALELKSANDIFIVHAELWTGIIIQILSLVLMYFLSVFKPWGRRIA